MLKFTSLDTLPDELVLLILEFSTLPNNTLVCRCPKRPSHDTAKALTLVSRRLNQLATSFLYRDLTFTVSSSAELHRTDISLRRYCRHLLIWGTDRPLLATPEWDPLITDDFLTGCARVRCLTVRGGFQRYHSETWDLISRLLANTPDLKHLRLEKHNDAFDLPTVVKYVQGSALQHLALHGISKSASAEPLLDSAQAGTAPFTSLMLSDYEEDADSTATLIRWPAHLRHFSLESRPTGRHSITPSMVGSWLSSHQDTLESLTLGALSAASTTSHLPDASRFPKLRVLALSKYYFAHPLAYDEAEAAMLLAPCLESFTWNLNAYAGAAESWDTFGEREELWLRQFATAASKTVPLKSIHVVFGPNFYSPDEETGFPWDGLGRVAGFCRGLGIEVTYTEPPLSKGEWLASRRVLEKEEVVKA
ncbi:uncharacterized protein GGS25DRAFT_509750 [Hypoxylon fragiforme]|uniref:uncharacterized protein n=1 Tax=Hypoxylon fragiforme TaxID=63214 RepID=UPI0020C7232E|nr:uncharacterized protein GGS25DRAFT_509750 [Hypoxylon fragiforme]KAI2603052.1 hypothetical protein GGS25DRAFT_509750 [Hypoxylon fragiforme]